MNGLTCSEHSDRPAVFGCQGCARRLCAECAREGHRLYFCVHCGEQATPLDPTESASVAVRRRQAKRTRAYSFGEALAYPFRGAGRMMIPAYVAYYAIASIVPGLGSSAIVLAQILLPGLLFEIVRTTAEGEVVLPDWPDYSDTGERGREILWFLLVQATALAPMLLFFYLADCDPLALFGRVEGAFCWGPWIAGVVLGVVVGVLAFGAVGTHSSGWLAFRVDLHLQALLSPAAGDALRVSALVAVLLSAAQAVQRAFGPLPLLGAGLSAAISGYAWFTGAHLVGLVFRRHAPVLDRIYRD